MNTQNVNVKTATKESSERWVKTSSLRTDGFVRNINSRNPFDVIRADVVLSPRNQKEKHMHLYLTESSAVPGMQATSEAERAYWLSREKAAVRAPEEIDAHAFHDALGLMYPMNWRSSEDGKCETFMLAEMICGNVTEIYVRIGIRYYRMRDYSNLDHAEILTRVEEVSDQSQK